MIESQLHGVGHAVESPAGNADHTIARLGRIREVVDQPLRGDRATWVQSQPDQQRAQTAAGDLNGPPRVVAYLERAEYADAHGAHSLQLPESGKTTGSPWTRPRPRS